jgi:hypothetical protein
LHPSHGRDQRRGKNEFSSLQTKGIEMKRIMILSCAVALMTGFAFAQTQGTLPQNPVPPPNNPLPEKSTPSPGTPDFTPPGQTDRDLLPPGRPFTTNPPPGRPFEDRSVPGRPFQDNGGTQPGANNTNSTLNPEGKGAPGSREQRGTGSVTNGTGAVTNGLIRPQP